MSALTDAQQAELQGLAKQLEAQGYSNEAISSALAGVNTMQTTQIGGLGSAANYAQPSTAGYGQTIVTGKNPRCRLHRRVRLENRRQ